MDNPVDRREILDEEVFSYRIMKDHRVFISWHGKHAVTLSGAKAEAFIANISNAGDKEAQLVMAKATGNFKRSNEKLNKRK